MAKKNMKFNWKRALVVFAVLVMPIVTMADSCTTNVKTVECSVFPTSNLPPQCK